MGRTLKKRWWFLAIAVIGLFLCKPLLSWGDDPVTMVCETEVSPNAKQVAFIGVHKRGKDEIVARLWMLSLPEMRAVEWRDDVAVGINSLSWSPDGSKIAFLAGTESHFGELHERDLLTGKIRTIAPSTCKCPKYSPDGKWLGFSRLLKTSPGHLTSDLLILNLHSNQPMVIENADHWSWCWSKDSKGVFCVRDGRILFQQLGAGGPAVIVESDKTRNDDKRIADLCVSPDGSQLGYSVGSPVRQYYLMNLKDRQSRKVFEFDHYFGEVQWNNTGILYLDQIKGERRSQGRLMLFDPNTQVSKQVATGSLSDFKWIDASRIVMRRENAELWILDLVKGSESQLLLVSNEAEKTSRENK